MNRLSRKQARTLAILAMIILFVFLLLVALMDISVFFVLLILLVAGICVLRTKKPELFGIFSRKPKEAVEEAGLKNIGINREGYSGHMVLLYHYGATSREVSVDNPEFTIGRQSSCNFVLSGNTDISRVHAIIRYDAQMDRSSVIDNNSTHGTKVNGDWLTPGVARTLHNGDIIQIEDRVLTVQNKNY